MSEIIYYTPRYFNNSDNFLVQQISFPDEEIVYEFINEITRLNDPPVWTLIQHTDYYDLNLFLHHLTDDELNIILNHVLAGIEHI